MTGIQRRSLLKALGLGAGVAGFAGMAGCGSDSGGGASDPLKYPSWMWTDTGVNFYWKESVEEYESRYPDRKIRTESIAPNNYADQITTEIAGGRRPDILPIFTNNLFSLLDNDLLEPLDPYLAKVDWVEKELPLAKVAKVDGKQYGVVCTASPQALVVNKKLLQQAGVDSVPTTVDELFAAAKTVKAKTGQWGFAFPMASSDVQNCYVSSMQWVLGYGSDWADETSRPLANADKTKEAIEMMVAFVKAGVVPTGMKVTDVRTLFKDGKVAFMLDGPFLLSFVKQANPALYSSLDFVDPPTPTHAAITGGALWVMLKGNKRNDEVWDYIALVNEAEWQRKWLEETAQLAGQNVPASEEFLKVNPWVANMLRIAANYQTGFGYAPPSRKIATYAAEWQKLVIDDLIPIWSGSKPVDSGLNQLQDKLEKWLKDKNIEVGS
jgi:ABC-type glycerol-3-phosphate transport system substrate-binding protein